MWTNRSNKKDKKLESPPNLKSKLEPIEEEKDKSKPS
jgi:hypothetical protein